VSHEDKIKLLEASNQKLREMKTETVAQALEVERLLNENEKLIQNLKGLSSLLFAPLCFAVSQRRFLIACCCFCLFSCSIAWFCFADFLLVPCWLFRSCPSLLLLSLGFFCRFLPILCSIRVGYPENETEGSKLHYHPHRRRLEDPRSDPASTSLCSISVDCPPVFCGRLGGARSAISDVFDPKNCVRTTQAYL
jgi:hypothetical protein